MKEFFSFHYLTTSAYNGDNVEEALVFMAKLITMKEKSDKAVVSKDDNIEGTITLDLN